MPRFSRPAASSAWVSPSSKPCTRDGAMWRRPAASTASVVSSWIRSESRSGFATGRTRTGTSGRPRALASSSRCTPSTTWPSGSMRSGSRTPDSLTRCWRIAQLGLPRNGGSVTWRGAYGLSRFGGHHSTGPTASAGTPSAHTEQGSPSREDSPPSPATDTPAARLSWDSRTSAEAIWSITCSGMATTSS